MTETVGDTREAYCADCQTETKQELYHSGDWICLNCDGDVETYAVSLSFREWMDICHALGYTTSMYRTEEMEGQARRYEAITEAITEQLKDSNE